MSLKIVTGDVFNELLFAKDAGIPVIFAHGCNCRGVQGSGVAALVKKLYPYAYDAYKTEFDDYGLVLGSVVWGRSPASSVLVANCMTQKDYGRDGSQYVNYDAVIESLQTVADLAKKYSLPVYLPLIGGGLGGGDVKRLTAIFQALFYSVDATLFLKED